MSVKAVFCDRDGTICIEKGPVHAWDDLEIFAETCRTFAELRVMGYELVIISNQGAVAKGLVTYNEVYQVNAALVEYFYSRGVPVLASMFCPHHPNGLLDEFTFECECRKPAPGMIHRAAKRFEIDISSSILIGDNISDVVAGERAGCRYSILVETGHGKDFVEKTNSPVLAGFDELPKWLAAVDLP